MDKIEEITIIGGGKSIQEGISLGLRERLEGKFVITCNYAYKHFYSTFLTFLDRDFYVPVYAKRNKNNPDIYEELKQLPLIIGFNNNTGLKEFLLPNTILVNCPKKELPNPYLTGIFALCIAEALEPKRIFLLGFDWTKQSIPENKKNYNPNSNLDIHYYKKEIQHRGLGYTGFYDNHNPNNLFKFFDNSKSKIYNVSLNSNIENFEKINYTIMFSLLSDAVYEQEELRKELKNNLTKY